MYKPGQFVNIVGTRCRATKSNTPCSDYIRNNHAAFITCAKCIAAAIECHDKLGKYMYPAPIKQPK